MQEPQVSNHNGSADRLLWRQWLVPPHRVLRKGTETIAQISHYEKQKVSDYSHMGHSIDFEQGNWQVLDKQADDLEKHP